MQLRITGIFSLCLKTIVKPIGTEMYFKVNAEHEQLLRNTKKENSGWKILDGEFFARASAMWYTNIDIVKRHKTLALNRNYSPAQYPKYDNYDAIEVKKFQTYLVTITKKWVFL